MSITITNLTVLGTDAPWSFLGSGSANAGSASVLVPFNAAHTDGTTASSGTGNTSFRYGQVHTTAGETTPTPLSVTAGQIIFLEYISGTVNTQAGGGTNTPVGATTTSISPLPGGGTDSSGYNLPTNVIPGFKNTNSTSAGTVNTSGTAVTWVSGPAFTENMQGGIIWINTVPFTVSSVAVTAQTMVIGSSAGTQTGVGWFFYSAQCSIGGLVGAFTDSSGVIKSLFDWKSWGGTGSANSFIALLVPAGATKMTLGINDSVLHDNTGSFSMTAFQMDSDYIGGNGFTGDQTFFTQYPAAQVCLSGGRDMSSPTNVKATVYIAPYCEWQVPVTGTSLLPLYFGQLFPHGAQQSGGNPAGTAGQKFPY